MKTLLRTLILTSSVATLIACGGGSSSTSTTDPDTNPDMTVSLSGVVYDEELANAEVAVYVGTDPTPVGTGVTDENGNYQVTLTVSEDVANQACIIRAVRGDFSLETLPGTVNTVAAAGTDNTVSASSLPGLNVTNVSTALLAVIRDANNGEVPVSQELIDAAEAAIEGDTVTQDLVLQLAAAIKVVIDSGVALPAGSTDTADLVADILANTTTFVADNQAAVDAAETVIESDPILAAQLIVPDITSADLTGQKYVVGEDTLLHFTDATNISTYDLESLAAGGPIGVGTWSLDEAQQVLTLNLTDTVDNLTYTVVGTFDGGNPNVIPLSVVVGGQSQGPQTLTKVLPAPTPPYRTFNTEASMMLAIDNCSGPGTTTNNNIMGALVGSMEVNCSVDSATGAMLLTPTSLLVNDGQGGVLPPFAAPHTLPIAVFALAGTDANAVRYVRWEQELDPLSGYLVPGSILTSYGKARVVSANKPIIPNAISLRIEAITGDTTVAFVNGSGTSIDIYKTVVATGVTNLFTKAIDNTVVTDPVSGFNPVVSTSPTGAVNYVFGLPGGTYALDSTGAQVTRLDTNNAFVPMKSVSYGGIAPDNATSAVVKTRVQYPLQPISVEDVSGKTFSYSNLITISGVDTVAFDTVAVGETGGTGTLTALDGPTFPFTWETSSGTLVVTSSGGDEFGDYTDISTFYKGYVDLGANSMLFAGYEYATDTIDGSGPSWLDNVTAFTLTQQ